ncbi:HepT-like ribonuclease domain-containing protein [Duncaniella freteri]
MIIGWNSEVKSYDEYLSSQSGMQKLAANSMIIQSIGEGVKKIDRLLPGFLNDNSPEIPWRNIKGIRDHIAHGYFDIDAEIIYDVTLNEIPRLRETFVRLYSLLS